MGIAPDDVAAVVAGLRDPEASVRKNAARIVSELHLNDLSAHDHGAHDHEAHP